jgi:hypothetical protein
MGVVRREAGCLDLFCRGPVLQKMGERAPALKSPPLGFPASQKDKTTIATGQKLRRSGMAAEANWDYLCRIRGITTARFRVARVSRSTQV